MNNFGKRKFNDVTFDIETINDENAIDKVYAIGLQFPIEIFSSDKKRKVLNYIGNPQVSKWENDSEYKTFFTTERLEFVKVITNARADLNMFAHNGSGFDFSYIFNDLLNIGFKNVFNWKDIDQITSITAEGEAVDDEYVSYLRQRLDDKTFKLNEIFNIKRLISIIENIDKKKTIKKIAKKWYVLQEKEFFVVKTDKNKILNMRVASNYKKQAVKKFKKHSEHVKNCVKPIKKANGKIYNVIDKKICKCEEITTYNQHEINFFCTWQLFRGTLDALSEIVANEKICEYKDNEKNPQVLKQKIKIIKLKYRKKKMKHDRKIKFKNIQEFYDDKKGLTKEYLKTDVNIVNEIIKIIGKSDWFPRKYWGFTLSQGAEKIWEEKFFGKKILEIAEKRGEIKKVFLKSEAEIKEKKIKNPAWKYQCVWSDKKLNPYEVVRYLKNIYLPTDWLERSEHKKFHNMFNTGGMTHNNPKWIAVRFMRGELSGIDRHSHYPAIMVNETLSYGKPYQKIVCSHLKKCENIVQCDKREIKFGNGGKAYPKKWGKLVVYKTLRHKNKKDIAPALKKLHSNNADRTEYFIHDLEPGTYYIAPPEWEYLKDNYPNYNNYKYCKKVVLYSFKEIDASFFFKEYVEYYYNIKKKAQKGSLQRYVAKLMLNSLFGKFGTKKEQISKFYVGAENEDDGWAKYSHETKSKRFLPIACEILAYGRKLLRDAIGTNYDKFVGGDTDSCKFINFDKKDFPHITFGNELGDWEVEANNVNGVVAGKKRYILGNAVVIAGYNFKKWYIPEEKELMDEHIQPFLEKLTYEDIILGKNVPNQITSITLKNGEKFLKTGEKEIKPLWDVMKNSPEHFPKSEEQIRKRLEWPYHIQIMKQAS